MFDTSFTPRTNSTTITSNTDSKLLTNGAITSTNLTFAQQINTKYHKLQCIQRIYLLVFPSTIVFVTKIY